jgi:hypothetical protein
MKRSRRLALLCSLGALAVPAAASAGPGSIVYVKGGKLLVSSPDGKVTHRIGKAGGWTSPSQDDRGNVVAQKGVYLYRMNRAGRLLSKPITTAFRTSPLLPAFNGPFWPQVSPDGRLIAYTYAYTAAHMDYLCNCIATTPSLNVAYTYANRFTDDPVAAFGNARMYSKPSWIDNRSVLMTTPELFNFAGTVLDGAAFDTVGGADDSYQRWFTECIVCDDLATLSMYRLDDGEMTRKRDKLAFVSGALDGLADGSRMLLYRMHGPPPAFPSSPCHLTGASGKFSSPTWSPDGRSLAWADAKGIWVGQVRSLDGQDCQLSRHLLIPGGAEPDWGPAAVG